MRLSTRSTTQSTTGRQQVGNRSMGLHESTLFLVRIIAELNFLLAFPLLSNGIAGSTESALVVLQVLIVLVVLVVFVVLIVLMVLISKVIDSKEALSTNNMSIR